MELVLGVERHLADRAGRAPRLVDVEPALLREHDQRRLGRVADDLAVAHRRVVGERHRQRNGSSGVSVSPATRRIRPFVE